MRLGRAIKTVIEVNRETPGTFLVATVILGFLSIFNKSQESSPFEAWNTARLSRRRRDVRYRVQIRWRPRAFSRACTGIQTSLHLVR